MHVSLRVSTKHKMVYLDYVKQRIVFFRRLGKSYAKIERSMAEESHTATSVGVCKFIRCCEGTGMIAHAPGSSQTLADRISQIVSHLARHPV